MVGSRRDESEYVEPISPNPGPWVFVLRTWQYGGLDREQPQGTTSLH
jgi:hypothetical protein